MIHMFISLLIAASFIGAPRNQHIVITPSPHNKCHHMPQPRMLGIMGNWECTNKGWRWVFQVPHR